jgi:hypothetical protein
MGLAAGFIAETLARFEANPCGIYGVQTGMGMGFSYSEYLGFPVLLLLHQCFTPAHMSLIQHRRYITVGNKSVVKHNTFSSHYIDCAHSANRLLNELKLCPR